MLFTLTLPALNVLLSFPLFFELTSLLRLLLALKDCLTTSLLLLEPVILLFLRLLFLDIP